MTSQFAKYAVELSNDGVSLWHRSSGQDWQLLGKVALEAPNFSADIEKLRTGQKIAGEEKLIVEVRIPRSEVYVSDIDINNTTGKDTTANVNSFLAQNTPYSADNLVFDLETPEGSNKSKVAAITKQTMAEANEFIQGHGFEALYFTTKLDKGAFPRNPRFYASPPLTKATIKPVVEKPESGDIPVPPPPKPKHPVATKQPQDLSHKAAKAPSQAPDTAPTLTAAPDKTDFSNFSTVRSKALIAEKTSDNNTAINELLPPPPRRISITPPAITAPMVEAVTEPDNIPKRLQPIPSPIKMPQGDHTKPNVRSFFTLRYILIFTMVILIAFLYWFYVTLFDGKEEIARLQAPVFVSEPVIAPAPPALKRKVSKDVTPLHPQETIALASGFPSIKAPVLPTGPQPVIIAKNTIYPPENTETKDISSPSAVMAEQAAVPLGTATTSVKIPAAPTPEPDPVVAALPATAPAAPDTTPPAPVVTETVLIPTAEGTAGPEGITLFTGRPDLAPAIREQLKISTDPLKNILPKMRSAAFAAIHKTEAATETVQEAVAEASTDPDRAVPETAVATDTTEITETPDLVASADPALKTKLPRYRPAVIARLAKEARNSLLAFADPSLADIKPRSRPATLAVPIEPSEIIVAIQQAVNDTKRPKARPASLRNTVASIKANADDNIQTAALTPNTAKGTSVSGKSSPMNIQKEATEKARFSKRRISLVGVYGTASNRRALVRMPSGRYVKVKPGQKFSGWKVSAIGESTVRITKGSRNQVLRMPR